MSVTTELCFEGSLKRPRAESYEKIVCVSICPGYTFYYETNYYDSFSVKEFQNCDNWRMIESLLEFEQIQKNFECLLFYHFEK